LILLLISELLTDIVSEESQMAIDEGGKNNYSETVLENELVFIDRSQNDFDTVHTISTNLLKKGKRIAIPDSSLSVRALRYFPNSKIARAPEDSRGAPLNRTIANKGIVERMDLQVVEQAMDYSQEAINTATAYIEVFDANDTSIGIWLVSNVIDDRFPKQKIETYSESLEVALRFKRYYHPFTVELIDFTHEKYPGTDIPFNFSSEVFVNDLDQNIKQKALIYMNHPLRYGGLTFYQASFANEDKTSILQVVRNPGWLLPYISVLLMGLGMSFQFGMHFIKFSRKAKH
jgi:hypothetical protein